MMQHDAPPPLQPDVVTFSTLIACCERQGNVARAEQLWESMRAQVRGRAARQGPVLWAGLSALAACQPQASAATAAIYI